MTASGRKDGPMGSLFRVLPVNFPLTLLVLGLVAGAIRLWHRPRPLDAATVVEGLFAWFLFSSVGIASFLNFLGHAIFGGVSAPFIGREDSPFRVCYSLSASGRT